MQTKYREQAHVKQKHAPLHVMLHVATWGQTMLVALDHHMLASHGRYNTLKPQFCPVVRYVELNCIDKEHMAFMGRGWWYYSSSII